VVALVRSRYPDLTAAQVADQLARTAKDLGPPGRDSEYGFGLVDPVAALSTEPAGTGTPWWLLALGAVGGVAVLAAVFLVIRRRRP